MPETYKIQIVSPEKVIFSDEKVHQVVLPSYEGEMGILKDHIPVILFLRPGIIKILKPSDNVDSFFIQDGIIEFYNNNLTILSTKIINIKNLNKEIINQLVNIGYVKSIADLYKLEIQSLLNLERFGEKSANFQKLPQNVKITTLTRISAAFDTN